MREIDCVELVTMILLLTDAVAEVAMADDGLSEDLPEAVGVRLIGLAR